MSSLPSANLNPRQRELLASLLSSPQLDFDIVPAAAAKPAAVPAVASTTQLRPHLIQRWPKWRLALSFSLAFFAPMVVLLTVAGNDWRGLLLVLTATAAWAVPTVCLGAAIRRSHAIAARLQGEIDQVEGVLEDKEARAEASKRSGDLAKRTLDELRIELRMTTEENARLREEVGTNAKTHADELSQSSANLKARLAEVWATLKRVEYERDTAREELQQKATALEAATTAVNHLAPRVEALEFENVDLQQQAAAAMDTFKQREHWSPVAISDEDLARALASSLK